MRRMTRRDAVAWTNEIYTSPCIAKVVGYLISDHCSYHEYSYAVMDVVEYHVNGEKQQKKATLCGIWTKTNSNIHSMDTFILRAHSTQSHLFHNHYIAPFVVLVSVRVQPALGSINIIVTHNFFCVCNVSLYHCAKYKVNVKTFCVVLIEEAFFGILWSDLKAA